MADGKSDEMKGRLKEGLGTLRGDDEQEREGQRDQAGGKLKQAAEKAKDAAGDAMDSVRRK